MARQVTLKFGFAGDVRDVTVVLPDGEPIPWQWGEQFSVLRRETPRVDGPLKATGSARYSYDVQMPGMLYGAILRSPYAHAMVRSVDLSGAREQSGVIAALRVEDNEVRFAGQEVAAVAAVSPEVATHALRHIKVEYSPLPFVVDMDKATAAGAPKVFGSRSNLTDPRVANMGDVARGFSEAAAVHEALYTTPVQTHVSLETHGAVASWKDDELTVWCSTQGVFTVRDDLAVLFELPPDKVRVITEYLGGGFGSKFGAGAEVVIAARLARLAGAPVKLMLPRGAEHVATGNRPSSSQRVKLGAGADGKLKAIELTAHGSGGIGGGSGVSGPYRSVYPCANLHIEERDVYLNAGPSSPMRAPGWVQGTFALELAMDELARKLKLDRLEFRRRNNLNPVRAAEFELGAQRVRMGGKERRRGGGGKIFARAIRVSKTRNRGRLVRMAQPGRFRPGGDSGGAARWPLRGARRHPGYRHRHSHGARDGRGGGTRDAAWCGDRANRRHALSLFGTVGRQQHQPLGFTGSPPGCGASQAEALSDCGADAGR